LQQREEHWVIADLVGKGGHVRTIPVPNWVKAGVDNWVAAAGITTGPLLRSINKAGRIWGNGFSPKVIWGVVKDKAASCEFPSLAGVSYETTEKILNALYLKGLCFD
jgi:hypothetical protein